LQDEPPKVGRSLQDEPPKVGRSSNEDEPPKVGRSSNEDEPPKVGRSLQDEPPKVGRSSNEDEPPKVDRSSNEDEPPKVGRSSLEDEPLTKHSHDDEKYDNISDYVTINNIDKDIDIDLLNKIFSMEFDDCDKIIIDENIINKYLNKPEISFETVHKKDCVGIINGLYATDSGIGGITPIQIFKNHIGSIDFFTKENNSSHNDMKIPLKLTGNQQHVMRESVICALTTAINILKKDIIDEIYSNFPNGFHVHAPDGGTPKDGPSAGCAFTIAFVSILLGKKINREVAMTGEIELTGKISKIGGLNAKLVGAKKAGVKLVFICRENEDDYIKIKNKEVDLFDDNFKIVIVDHILDIVTHPNVILDVDNTYFDLNK
jgi:ATP-dependent Lon protease